MFRKRKQSKTRKPKERKSRAMTTRKRGAGLPVGGFGTRYLAKLRYVQNVTLDAGAGTFSVNAFRANGMFDPDSTGVGHQPSNFDKLASIYDTYTVIGSQIKAYWVPTSSTVLAIPPVLVIHLSEDGTEIATAHGSGGVSNVLEQPRISRTIKYVGQATTSDTPPLVKNFSAKKFFGISNFVGKHPYSADITADPTEGAFFEVACISPDDAVNPSEAVIRIEIEYVAVWTEPKIADAS